MSNREATLSPREADGNPLNYYLDLGKFENSADSTVKAKEINVDSGSVPDGDGDCAGAAINIGSTAHLDCPSTSPVCDAPVCNVDVETTPDAKRICCSILSTKEHGGCLSTRKIGYLPTKKKTK